MAYEKLDTYIAAYNRGASASELAAMIGIDASLTSSVQRVSTFNSILRMLGVVGKRPNACSDDERERRRQQCKKNLAPWLAAVRETKAQMDRRGTRIAAE